MKYAIVTGASSGIGYAISKMLFTLEFEVYGFGRSFSDQIDSPNWHPICCDFTKLSELEEKIKQIRKNHTISLLINNAGVGYFGPHEQLDAKKIHELVSVNLEAPLLITQLLLRDLKKEKGHIINVSSITAKQTNNTYGCAYGATKAALSSFSASLFAETRKYGVNITTLHPDITKSNFYRNADFKEGISENSYLLGEEIANTIQWILNQREGIVVSDLTIRPQKHELRKRSQIP